MNVIKYYVLLYIVYIACIMYNKITYAYFVKFTCYC